MLALLVGLHDASARYSIMVDAGSSGTRAHIYQWWPTRGLPKVQPLRIDNEIVVLTTYKRLAKAASNASMIPDIFEEIVNFAVSKLPHQVINRVKMFVFATAGLRLLSLEDRNRVMDMTRRYLKRHSPFKIGETQIRVISGVEEGLFGWLSVNHLMNRL